MGKKRGRDSFVFLVINQTSFVNIESRPLFRIHGSYTSTTTGNDTSTNTSNDSDEGDQDTDIKTDSPTFTTIQTGNYLTSPYTATTTEGDSGTSLENDTDPGGGAGNDVALGPGADGISNNATSTSGESDTLVGSSSSQSTATVTGNPVTGSYTQYFFNTVTNTATATGSNQGSQDCPTLRKVKKS